VLTALWNLIIVNPLLNLLVFIYSIVGNYGVAILLFTVFIKVVTLPFSMQQQKAMKKQAAVAPELEVLKKKYGKDQQKYQQEMMKIYKERGINPLGGCLPMLIPWPIFVAFYQSVQSVMSTQPESFMQLSQHIMPALASQVPVRETFLWLNLARPDPLYILPVLAVATTWLQQKMMAMPSTDAQAQSMNQTMGIFMPLFMGYITMSFASGLAIYWVAFNIVGIIQQYFVTGWGELRKYIPAPILVKFPGPVPVAVAATSGQPAAKSLTRPRRSVAEDAGSRPARRRSVDRAEVERDELDEASAPVSSATALPAKSARRRSATRNEAQSRQPDVVSQPVTPATTTSSRKPRLKQQTK